MSQKIDITRDFIQKIRESIIAGDERLAKSQMLGLHPADIAEVFNILTMDEVLFLFRLLDESIAADTLVEIEEDDRERLLKALPSEDIAQKYLDNMESDDAADVLADMDEKRQEEVLSQMDDMEQAGDIVALLHYEEDTAGGIMAKEYIAVKEAWTVDECIKEIRRQVEEVEEVYYVYVLNDDGILHGILSLKTLLISPANRKVVNLCQKNVISVKTDMKDEKVAQIMQKYDLVVLPVVDSLGRLVGRITIDDVVDVIRDEADKDYQMISGISEDIEPDDSLLVQTRARLPWLVVGLVGGILGASVIRIFEPQLAKITGLILFLPLIGAMAGNVGVQSSSIIVQGLASNRLNISGLARRIFREMGVSMVNGLMLSALLFLYNYLTNDNYLIAVTVSLALFTVVIFASFSGALIPLLLHKRNIDPALATGPFITTINDIAGLLIYLSLAKIMFGAFGIA